MGQKLEPPAVKCVLALTKVLIPKDTPSREYADIKTRPPEEGTVSLVGKISGVHVPLGGRFLKPATALVAQGDLVSYEQKIGEPVDEGFSIGVWASMGGTVSSTEHEVSPSPAARCSGRKPSRRPRPR
jgi:hypothetical protein